MADLFDEQLLNDPDSVPGWDASRTTRKPWPSLEPKETIELAAMGSGVYVCPASVARTYGRRDAAAIPISDLPPTPVRLLWWRAEDSPLTQRFVGVVRGRTSNSSRGSQRGLLH